MTVKVTKPAINLREELADLRKPTGIAGEAMLRAETPQEQFNLIGAGRRNIIINGAMQVAQRGTSSTSNGYVSLDRWYVNQSGGSTTFSQETNSNPSETDGLQKYARLNVSSSSDYCHIRQPIEDVTSVPSGTVTLSFYAKGTAPAGGLYTYGIQNFGSGGSSDVDWTPVLITSTLTSSWVRYTAEITVPSIDGKTIGSGSYFLLDIGQYSNTGTTAYDLNITGVQLELGKVATPFEHRSYGEELALCKRYFERIGTPAGSNYQSFGIGHVHTTTVAVAVIPYEVEKRVSPTASYDTGSNFAVLNQVGGAVACTSVGTSRISTHSVSITANSSGLVAGNATFLLANSVAKPFIDIDAELV